MGWRRYLSLSVMWRGGIFFKGELLRWIKEMRGKWWSLYRTIDRNGYSKKLLKQSYACINLYTKR